MSSGVISMPGGSHAPCITPIGLRGLHHSLAAASESREGKIPSVWSVAVSGHVQKTSSTEPGIVSLTARSSASEWSVRPCSNWMPSGLESSLLYMSTSLPLSGPGCCTRTCTVTIEPSRTEGPAPSR